tara:strand:+ start:18572 stop:18688 length:117 start_codon:yes stop_codon:yes gene_type:complete
MAKACYKVSAKENLNNMGKKYFFIKKFAQLLVNFKRKV